MADKAKRRPNPRRRLLMQISVLLALIGVIVAALIAFLQPTGDQIVFMGPDENYERTLWIADLQNPARRYPIPAISNGQFQVIDGTQQLVYIDRPASQNQHASMWLIDLSSGEKEQILSCNRICWILDIHPNGRWIAYTDGYNSAITAADSTFIAVIDLQTRQQFFPGREQLPGMNGTPVPQWIGDSGQLILGATNYSSDEIAVYDVESDQITEENPWYHPNTAVHFSPDGQYFVERPQPSGTLTIRSYASGQEVATLPDSSYPRFHRWHPDSARILITETASRNDAGWQYNLALFNIVTGERTRLMPRDLDSAHNLNHFQFSPDGTRLLYEVATGYPYMGISQLMVLDLESGIQTTLPLFGTFAQWVNN